MNCRHCDKELRQHIEGSGASKEGAYHCDGCGCCFIDEGNTPRPGVPLCLVGQATEAYPSYSDMPVSELRQFAEGHDVDLSGASRKDEIVERIESAPAPSPEPELPPPPPSPLRRKR
jgi:hypothetical protein